MIQLEFDRGTLVAKSSGEHWDQVAYDFLQETGFVPDGRIGAMRAPASVYRELLLGLTSRGIAFADKARVYGRWPGDPFRSHFRPYAHQQEALAAWSSRHHGVVVLPTGTGKTFLALLAMAKSGRDTLIVVPTLDLMAQWVGVIRAWLDIPVGTVGGGEYNLQPITVITYDSASRKIEHLGNRFGLLICDECHHLAGPVYRSIADLAIAPFRLGLTATIDRADGGHEEILQRLGPVVFDAPVRELSGTVLAPYHTTIVEVDLTDEEATEYDAARAEYLAFCRRNRVFTGSTGGWSRFLQLAFRSMDGRAAFAAYRRQKEIPLNSKRKEETLERLLLQHSRDRILIFTHVNELAYRIARSHLLPVITHQTPPSERAAILEGFSLGTYRAVVTSKVLNEGVDVPEANVAIVFSGSGSQREHIQRLGRILRKGADGKQAVLYELITRNTHEAAMSERRRNKAYFEDVSEDDEGAQS